MLAPFLKKKKKKLVFYCAGCGGRGILVEVSGGTSTQSWTKAPTPHTDKTSSSVLGVFDWFVCRQAVILKFVQKVSTSLVVSWQAGKVYVRQAPRLSSPGLRINWVALKFIRSTPSRLLTKLTSQFLIEVLTMVSHPVCQYAMPLTQLRPRAESALGRKHVDEKCASGCCPRVCVLV